MSCPRCNEQMHLVKSDKYNLIANTSYCICGLYLDPGRQFIIHFKGGSVVLYNNDDYLYFRYNWVYHWGIDNPPQYGQY